jgi:putative YjhG/YagF family dehydratase
MITLEYAAEMGCRACGSPGGGCQFLGTAATSQVVAEAFGLSLPHSALSPSGEPVWYDMARRSALALLQIANKGITLAHILTPEALENAMLVHAALGGSTNLLLHIPAIAHAAGLPLPTVHDWNRVNRAVPRLVDALPNGPRNHPTVQVFMAGGVPEMMLHLRRMGLLNTKVVTVSGETLDTMLDWWGPSERRRAARAKLIEAGVNPEYVIMSPETARREGLTSTVVFPTGNLAPEGSVIKATAIDPSVVDDDQVYRHRGPARVFTSERDAIRAVKGLAENPVKPGEVIVLMGGGPLGTGMEETAQITIALKFLPWGKHVPLLTDARFSGVSTGPCIGHIGPEALAGGPIGKLRDGDVIELVVDRANLMGQINLIGTQEGTWLTRAEAAELLEQRTPHPGLAPHPDLPDDTRLWAALQNASGGVWRGAIYDVDRIIEVINAGLNVVRKT